METKPLLDAVKEAITKSKSRKFLEAVEVAINLKDVDLSNPKNRIREEIVLPNGRGKKIKIAVFGGAELADKAKPVADLVITPDQIDDLATDKRRARTIANEHEFFLADASLMPHIGRRLGTILGPRGKMPKPLPASADPVPIINSLRNTVRVQSKESRTFHLPVGTRAMSPEALAENIEAVLKRIESKLERGRMNIKSVYVKTTMGPAIRFM
jgi:large subunit ribosomal protein L1